MKALISLTWLAATFAIAVQFHYHAPLPYMDEPFHVPQTMHYCHGRWQVWDPKITTFPGLYVAGTAYAHALIAASRLRARFTGGPPLSLETACSTTALRLLNLLFGTAALLLLAVIHKRLHPNVGASRSLATAVVLSLFPVHFFFQFLYYTDVGSAALVLAAYLCCLEKLYQLAALAAAAATGMRQTNAVWAAFTLGVAVLQECGLQGPNKANAGLVQQIASVLQRSWQRRGRLAANLWPLTAVPAAFAVFAKLNGGIVVGDRQAHAPALHLAQPLYFALFSAAALAPAALSSDRLKAAKQQLAASPLWTGLLLPVATAAALAAVDRGTIVHPYLLADNRHYTFYLWRRTLGRSETVRRAAVPLYMAACLSLWGMLRRRQSALWCAAFAGCTTVVLVPAALVEFRYFTIPFLLLALHMQPMRWRQLALTGALFAAVNAATIYAFLHRPYRWVDGSVARFMW